MSRKKCNAVFWKDLGVTSRFVHLEWLSLNCLSLLFWIRDNLLHPQPSFVSLWFIITLLLGRTIHSPWSISAKSLSASLNEMFLKAGCTITRFTYSEVQVSKYWIIPLSIRSAFHLSNVHLPWFGITTLVTRHSDCLKRSPPICYPITSRTKTNRDPFTHVFMTCTYFKGALSRDLATL